MRVNCLPHTLTHIGWQSAALPPTASSCPMGTTKYAERLKEYRRGNFCLLSGIFASFFCSHHLRHEAAHFLRGLLLHLPCDVGVGAEGEACVVVAERAGHLPHGLRQFQHGFPRRDHQFITRFAFLLVDVQQLLTENLIGQRGLDLPYPIFGQVRLIRIHRPRHHVDVRMITFVMEGGVPTKILRRDLHRRGDVIAVGTQ